MGRLFFALDSSVTPADKIPLRGETLARHGRREPDDHRLSGQKAYA